MLVVMPSDHIITGTEAFRAAVTRGASHAEESKVVTFGIRPAHPETGYGYIQAGKALPGKDGGREISAFTEKPDSTTARRYVASG